MNDTQIWNPALSTKKPVSSAFLYAPVGSHTCSDIHTEAHTQFTHACNCSLGISVLLSGCPHTELWVGPSSRKQTKVVLEQLRLGFGVFPRVYPGAVLRSRGGLAKPLSVDKDSAESGYGLSLAAGKHMSWAGWVSAWETPLEERPPLHTCGR